MLMLIWVAADGGPALPAWQVCEAVTALVRMSAVHPVNGADLYLTAV